jgi:hypothetical protein
MAIRFAHAHTLPLTDPLVSPEAVGKSVLSGRFKRLLVWLENLLVVSVGSCC